MGWRGLHSLAVSRPMHVGGSRPRDGWPTSPWECREVISYISGSSRASLAAPGGRGGGPGAISNGRPPLDEAIGAIVLLLGLPEHLDVVLDDGGVDVDLLVFRNADHPPAREVLQYPAALGELPVALLQEAQMEPLPSGRIVARDCPDGLERRVVHDLHVQAVDLDFVRVVVIVEQRLELPRAREEQRPFDVVGPDDPLPRLCVCCTRWPLRQWRCDVLLGDETDLAVRVPGERHEVDADAGGHCDGKVGEDRDDGDEHHDQHVDALDLAEQSLALPVRERRHSVPDQPEGRPLEGVVHNRSSTSSR